MNFFLLALAIMIFDLLLTWTWRIGRASRARRLTRNRRHMQGASYSGDCLISIVIPAWNEEQVISDCLCHIEASDDITWECIVVAGGDDLTNAIARDWAARDTRIVVLNQRPSGKNGALNDGIAVAKGDMVILLDADCQVPPDYLTRAREGLVDHTDIIVPNYYPLQSTGVSESFMVDKIRSYQILGRRELFGGASIIARRARIAELLPLPEDLEAAVDWDLGRKVARKGWHVAYAPDIHIKTEIPSRFLEYMRQQLRWRRALLKWILKDAKKSGFVEIIGNAFPYAISTLLCALLVLSVIFVVADWYDGEFALFTALAFSWNTTRNVSPVAEVAVFTHNVRWMKIIGFTALLHLIDLFVTFYSIPTRGSVSRFFKGERTQREKR